MSFVLVLCMFVLVVSGFIVVKIGWFDYFIVCIVFVIFGMLLLFRIVLWNGIVCDGEVSCV